MTEEFSCSVKIFAVEERSKVNIMEMNLDNLLDELRSSLPEGEEETGSKNNTTGSEVKQSRNRNQSSNNSKSSSDDVSGQGLGL